MACRSYGRIERRPQPRRIAYRCSFTDGYVFFPTTASADMRGLLPSARFLRAEQAAREFGRRTGRVLAAVTEV